MKVTAEEVKNAMIAKGIESVDHHDCAFCGYMCRFVRQGDQLFFDPGCHCKYGEPQPKSWQDAAGWINMQNAEWQVQIAAKFGLELVVT